MYSNKYGCCLVSPLVLYPALLCGGTVLCWFYTFILLQRAEHQVYTKAFAESWNISQVHSHIRPLVTCATNVHYLHDYFKSLWDISTIGTPVITCNLKSLLILWSTGFFSFCYSSKVSSRQMATSIVLMSAFGWSGQQHFARQNAPVALHTDQYFDLSTFMIVNV